MLSNDMNIVAVLSEKIKIIMYALIDEYSVVMVKLI